MLSVTRWVTAVFGAALLAGCVSTSVEKVDPRSSIRPRDPKPRENRKTVAVVDFEDKSEYGRVRVGTAAADTLMSPLMESEQFILYDRQQIAKVLDEQKFGQSGAVDPTTAIQSGKIKGVNYIFYGVVSNVGIAVESTNLILYNQKRYATRATVEVRMIDATTGEIVYMKRGDGLVKKDATGTILMGGSMGYDETMVGEALASAIYKMLDEMLDKADRLGN